MPAVLAVPTTVLAAVALVVWRLDRRLLADRHELAASTDRLVSLRAAVAALGAQVDEARRRHDALTGQGPLEA